MAKPTPQQCHALTTYFVNKYNEVLERQPVYNRNKARWGFESILMDYSTPQVKGMLDYYVEHWTNPNLEWFMFNYDKVVVAMEEHDKEEKSRARRREETAKRVEAWRKRWEK